MADGARTFTDQDSGDLIIDGGQEQTEQKDMPHFGNLSDGVITPRNLDILSSTITELVAWDESEREKWEELLAENTKLLGLGPETEADNVEDENSDTSDHPLMLTALLRFQSKALSALLPAPDRVCRTECALDLDMIEDETQRDDVREASDEAGRRVEKFFADYLLKRHKTYREDTDKILYDCGMHGMGIRKIYNDFSRAKSVTRVEHVDLSKLVLSYDTKSFTCGRITEIIDMPTPDLIRNITNGTYRSTTLSSAMVDLATPLVEAEDRVHGLDSGAVREGETHRIYEVAMELFLSDDQHPKGLARPYIITIHAATQEILSLRRNWQEGDEDEEAIERYVGYIFQTGKNAVNAMGLGQILSNSTRALRRAQRRGLEAAYLQNHPSGFKLSSMKIRDDGAKIIAGEFVDVDTPTNDIRSALMLHPFQGPSQGLMTLADKMEQNGRELGGIAAIDFSQLMKAGVAAGPAMAAYDESTEFQTAIHSRLHHSHASELRLIMDRMREVHGSNPIPFGVNSTLQSGDLTLVDLTPIMRPNQTSRQRQILEASAMMDLASAHPDIIDLRRAVEDYVKAVGKPDVSLYILPDPSEEPPEPRDPVSEYMGILNGMPVRAGMHQNHQAHIDAHAAQMRMVGTSQLPIEKGEAAMAMLAAHIAEHMGMQMIADVASRLGIPAEQFGQITPEMEAQLAPVMAEQIAAIEAERAPPEERGESKVEVEMVKGQNTQAIKALEHQQAVELAELKAQHERALQTQRDEAAMDRSIQDDETALEIAAMKDRNTAPTRAGGIS